MTATQPWNNSRKRKSSRSWAATALALPFLETSQGPGLLLLRGSCCFTGASGSRDDFGDNYFERKFVSNKQCPAFCDVGTVTPGVSRVPVAVETVNSGHEFTGLRLNWSCLHCKMVSALEGMAPGLIHKGQ